MRITSDYSHSNMVETWNRPDVKGNVVDVHEACGVILAIVTGPKVFLPSDWMSMLVTTREAGWHESSAAGEVLDRAMAYWNFVDDLIENGNAVPFPRNCKYSDGQVSLELDAFVEGYLRGQEFLEDAWEATGTRHQEPISLILDFSQAALVYLCGNQSIRGEMLKEHPGFPHDPSELMELFPRVFCELGMMGKEIARFSDGKALSSDF